MTQNLRFSGHESFHCRTYWLKKGTDYLTGPNKFNSDDDPVALGVGKNMVTSIRFWLRSFGVTTEKDELTEIAQRIFSDDGWDPYLEDIGTLWLLHYWLVTTSYSSIYSLFFNELRKSKPEFSINHFLSLVGEKNDNTSPNTLKKDFQTFGRMYVPKADMKEKDVEESYSGILTELDLVKETKKGYLIEPGRRPSLPPAILLYCIVEKHAGENSIDFERLYSAPNSVGSVFALNREGMTELLEELQERYPEVVFSNEAGIRELQFKAQIKSEDILNRYYEG